MRAVELDGKGLANQLPTLFEDFDPRFARHGARFSFRIAGLVFQCRCADGHYRDIAAPMVPAAPDGAVPDVRILVDLPDQGTASGWPRWAAPYFQEREVEAALASTPFRLHFHDQTGFWQVFDRSTNRGLQLMRDAAGYPAWDPGSPLRNLIHWALADKGGGLVHAGTLGQGGRGLLLAGSGGSGKSGTVLAGLLQGLDSLGDDYVAVTTGGGLRAHRAFNSLKQDAAGFDRLGLARWLGTGRPLNWQGKHLFTFDDLALPPQPDAMAIAALCLPQITGASRTTFAPVPAREAFLALAPSGISQIPAARPESFRLCAALSRDLPAYRVRLGTDPVEIAAAFARFLEGALP